MKRFVLIFAIFFVLFSSVAYAHPGSTDSNGGHYDRSTGEYHYHHGYPAHSHEGGTCPYDFDDKTGENSGSSDTRSRSSEYNSDVRLSSETHPSFWARFLDAFVPLFIGIPLLFFSFVLPAISLIVKEIKQRRSSRR